MAFSKSKAVLLFAGDVVFLYITLALMLSLSYFPFPEENVLIDHLIPFSILIGIWILAFFIAGLYERTVLLSKRSFASLLIKVQTINTVVAVFFFYLVPFFGITPKTNLFIYLVVSFLLLIIWRLYLTPLLYSGKKSLKAFLIAPHEEIKKLTALVNKNPQYDLTFVKGYDIGKITHKDLEKIRIAIEEEGVSHIVIDMNAERSDEFPFSLFTFLFTNVQIVDISDFCENLFGKVPSSSLSYRWFIEHIPETGRPFYDFLKRTMDIILSCVGGIITLPLYPLIWVAIKLDDGGDVFFKQERIGKEGERILITKFRSIKKENEDMKVTHVGEFLRATRLDELPQLWSVLKGDLSLIGPRPELPSLVHEYTAQIPYYNIRHIIKPGLSGWAQIFHENHPHHHVDVEETQEKLSYDLYYIKNRSLLLDVIIALKTIRILLSRKGK